MDKYLELARELKKLLNIKVTIIPIVIGALGTVTKGLLQRLGLGNNRMSGDHLNYCFIEITQNTEKSPDDLGRLLPLWLQWKILKE